MSKPLGTTDLDPILVSKFKQLQISGRARKQVLILESIEHLCQFAHKPLRFPERAFNILDEDEDDNSELNLGSGTPHLLSSTPSSPIPPMININPNDPISFGEQHFLNELFFVLRHSLNQSTLKRVSLFWAKFTYHYPEYFMVFLSNHLLLSAFFETIRRLLQKPQMLFVLENLCEPFLHFTTHGQLSLQHFLDNSPVFNPLINPRTNAPDSTPPMNPSSSPPPLSSGPSQLIRLSTFSTLFNTAKVTDQSCTTPLSFVPSVVSPRASMSLLVSSGMTLPGQKLDIFTLIGFPLFSPIDLHTFPQRLSLLFRSFPVQLNADCVLRILDEISAFFMKIELFSPRVTPAEKISKKDTNESLPTTKWYSRSTAPDSVDNVKEIAICKYQPLDIFHNDLQQHAIDAYTIALEVIHKFILNEITTFTTASPSSTSSKLPSSIATFIDLLSLHTFSQISLQIYFHPRARFLTKKFYQEVVLQYSNLPQLLSLFQKGYFISYYPGPEYGISILCQDIYIVLTENMTLSSMEKENFVLALFQLSPVFQVTYLYLMYACSIEHISDDPRLKYSSPKDFYWFTAMMLSLFNLSTSICSNANQSFKFMQYFASIAMFRFVKWSKHLIQGECEVLMRTFFQKKTASSSIEDKLKKYALQPISILHLLTYLYDWLYAHSSLGTYIPYKNISTADVPIQIELPEQFYVLNDYQHTLPNTGQFIEFDQDLEEIVIMVQLHIDTQRERREQERLEKQLNEIFSLSLSTPISTPTPTPDLFSLNQSTDVPETNSLSTSSMTVDVNLIQPQTLHPPETNIHSIGDNNDNHSLEDNDTDDGVDEYQQALPRLLQLRQEYRTNYNRLISLKLFPLKTEKNNTNCISEEFDQDVTPEQQRICNFEHPLEALSPQQRDPIQQWASKMLRNSTLSKPEELSQCHLEFYLFSNTLYEKLITHVCPLVGNQFVSHNNPFVAPPHLQSPTTEPQPAKSNVLSTNSITTNTFDSKDTTATAPNSNSSSNENGNGNGNVIMKIAQFPILSDVTLAEYSENLIKVYIAGLLLEADEFDTVVPLKK